MPRITMLNKESLHTLITNLLPNVAIGAGLGLGLSLIAFSSTLAVNSILLTLLACTAGALIGALVELAYFAIARQKH